MRQYKFDKPLVESTFPPQDVNTYWVDVDESTRKLLTIKEFSQADGEWKTTMRMPDYYLVNITLEGEGATLACNKPWYKTGDTVTLTATVEEGYEIAELAASWAGGDITLTEEDENVWSFEMPAGDVQVVGSAGKNEIKFISGDEDLSIFKVSCDGDITIETIKNGSAVTNTYSNLSEESVALSCDANTQVSIIGSVTKIVFYNWDDDTEEPVNISELDLTKCKTLTYLDITRCQNLTSIDVSKNTALANLICENCSPLTALDVSKNYALTYLDCGSCPALIALDLSKNTALTSLACIGCIALEIIKYPATDSSVSTAIASAITAATSTTGTVYTDSAAAYYSTISTAATTKGWTIEQLPA